MHKILAGIRHFQSKVFSSQEKIFLELSKGQQPPVLLITCSDSRICPTTLTQQQLGELFVLRTAGNIVPEYGSLEGGEAATVEYAVGVLKVSDVVICGHSHCGAMKGLLHPEMLESCPSVKSYLKHAEITRQIVDEKFHDVTCEKELLERTIETNVLVQMDQLKTHPTVAAALAEGTVRVHGWVYTIETGCITAFDESRGQFVNLCDCENYSEDLMKVG